MIFRGKAGEFLQLLNEVYSTTFELTELFKHLKLDL